MSGNNIVADTSLLINLFNGVSGIRNIIAGKTLFISVITEIEVLSFSKLTSFDKALIKSFLSNCYIIDLEPGIKEFTISIRSEHKVKLPDSIIAATAMYFDLPLFTMDKGFTRINDLQVNILSF